MVHIWGKIIDFPENHGWYVGANHGKSMENHRKSMENNGKDMENPWKICGKPTENIGNIMVDMWGIIPWNGWETIAIWQYGGSPKKIWVVDFMENVKMFKGWFRATPFWETSFFGLTSGRGPAKEKMALIQVNEIWQFTQMPAAHCDVSWRFYLI